MKLNIVFYLATSILLLASCAKVDVKTADAKKTYTFNAGLEYINLPLNRNFIYKDSATGSTSNVKVTLSMVEKKYESPVYFWEDGFYYETYMLVLSKISGTNIETWFSGYARSYKSSGYYGLVIDNSSFSFYDEQAGATCFFYPFSSDTIGRYGFIPVMNIEGKTYREVHWFISTNGLNPSDSLYKKFTYYWVKGIGIIKMEIIVNNTVQTSLLIQYG